MDSLENRKESKTRANYAVFKWELSITELEDLRLWTQQDVRLILAHSFEDFSLWPGTPVVRGKKTWEPLGVKNFSMTIARKPKEEERNMVEGRRKIRGGRTKERRRTEGEISVTPSKANIGSLPSSAREKLPPKIIYSPTVPCSRNKAFNIQALGRY